MRICFGPFILDLDTRQLKREDREIQSHRRRSSCCTCLFRSVRGRCPRPSCRTVSGPTRSLPRPTYRTSWPRFGKRSTTGPALPGSSALCTVSATRSVGTRSPCRPLPTLHQVYQPAGSNGGRQRLCAVDREHVIGRDPRRGSTARRINRVAFGTRSSWSPPNARSSRTSAARTAHGGAASALLLQSSSPMGMRSASGRY